MIITDPSLERRMNKVLLIEAARVGPNDVLVLLVNNEWSDDEFALLGRTVAGVGLSDRAVCIRASNFDAIEMKVVSRDAPQPGAASA